VTSRQAADYLRVHLRTIQRYARDGEIPSFRVGNRFRFRRADVESFVVDGRPGDDDD
jgi:excisionase family DNA binding protein